MVRFYRRMDGLSALTYRGLSFIITMAPLLLLSDISSTEAIVPFLLPILIAAFAMVFANWAGAVAYNYLPVGIASGVGLSVSAISVSIIAFLWFNEHLTVSQFVLIGLLLAGVVLLGLSRAPREPLHTYSPVAGLLAAVLFGVGIAVGNSLLSLGARRMDPMISAYVWETAIGLFSLILVQARGALYGNGLEKIPLTDFLMIALYSFPTVIGTACLVTAMSLGPLAIIQAVLTLITISSTLLAWWIYKEKLELTQWYILFLLLRNCRFAQAGDYLNC